MPKIDKPEPGKIYALTGAKGTPSIAAGNSWAESEVTEKVEPGTNTWKKENAE